MKFKLSRKIIGMLLSTFCAFPINVSAAKGITKPEAETLKSWCCDEKTEGWKEFIDEHLTWDAAFVEDYTNSNLLFFAADCANTQEKVEIVRDIFNRLLNESEKRELLETIDCFKCSAKECAKRNKLELVANLIEELEKEVFFDDYPANENNILNCSEFISNMLRPKLDKNGMVFSEFKKSVDLFIFYLNRMIINSYEKKFIGSLNKLFLFKLQRPLGFTKSELICAMSYIERYLSNTNTPPVNIGNEGTFVICALMTALKYCNDGFANVNNCFAHWIGKDKIATIQKSELVLLQGLEYNCYVKPEDYKRLEKILNKPISIAIPV